MTDQFTPRDPRSAYPRPDQPPQSGDAIDHPGLSEEMEPRPDYGEDTYRGTGRLDGRRALITGGDSGIGRAVALAFAREGADVAFTYLPEEQEDADETTRLVEDAGRRALAISVDLQVEANCRDVVDRTVRELGGLDVLVNNAAYQMAQDEGLAGISTEQLERVFRTNVFAMFWLTQAALPHLRPGAAIINTTSIQATHPSPTLLDYACTKAAILNFTRGLAEGLAPEGIRVNAVAPGPIWTPLIPSTMPQEAVQTFGKDTPLGRAGQPAELAPIYVFLASQESSYVTGDRIAATGGKIV
jgi:NAD(P)-dependent dehydrogenase (short-subunit alcohol dehydrogenase family)